mmetsp:Transcript_46330/g.108732  ORF Transcript_46330/g.108732 Transcript_46330/m.108732 type:complete len:747 (+) Transcript_46330:267-2507(+)
MASSSDTFAVTPSGCLPFLRFEKLPAGGVILRVQRTQACAVYLTDDQSSFSLSFQHLSLRDDDVEHTARVLDQRQALDFVQPGMLVRVGVDGRYIWLGSSARADTIELVWKSPVQIPKIMEPAITRLPLPPSSPPPHLEPDSTTLPSPTKGDSFDIISLADAVLSWQDSGTKNLSQLSSNLPWNRIAAQILQICKRPGRRSHWRVCFSDGNHYLWQSVPLRIMTHCHAKLVPGAVAWIGNWRLGLHLAYATGPHLFDIISSAPLPPIGNPVSVTTIVPFPPIKSFNFSFDFNARSDGKLRFPVDISPVLRDRFQSIDWESHQAKDGGGGIYAAQPLLDLTKPAPDGRDPDKSDHIAEDAVMLSAYDCEVFYAMAPVAECTVALLTEPTLQLGNRIELCEILRSYAVAAKLRGFGSRFPTPDERDGVGPNPLEPTPPPPMDDVVPCESALKARAVAQALVAPEALSRIAQLIASPPPVHLRQEDQLKLAFLVSSVKPFPDLAAQPHVRQFVETLAQLASQRRFATDGAELGVDELVYAAMEAAGADHSAPLPPSLLALCQDILTNSRSTAHVQAAVLFALARCADRKEEVLDSDELRSAAWHVCEELLARDPGLRRACIWPGESRGGARGRHGNHVTVAWECLVKLFPASDGEAVLWHKDNLVRLLEKAPSSFPGLQDLLQLVGIEKLASVDERTFLDDDALVGWWKDHGCERQLRCLRALGSVSRFITVDWTEWGLPGDMAAWARV